MKKYCVIGGHYEPKYYGESNTLLGAKLIAARNDEYWDNFKGWHRPKIYRVEDTEEIISRGRILTHDGQKIRIPIGEPILVYYGKWINLSERKD